VFYRRRSGLNVRPSQIRAKRLAAKPDWENGNAQFDNARPAATCQRSHADGTSGYGTTRESKHVRKSKQGMDSKCIR
jgi:hypothetical protein